MQLEDELRAALPRSDEAFRLRDFDTVVETLEPFDGRLPPAAQAKLDHARTKLGR